MFSNKKNNRGNFFSTEGSSDAAAGAESTWCTPGSDPEPRLYLSRTPAQRQAQVAA